MADSMSFDFSEVTKLAADLGTVAPKSGPFINSAVQVTATKVKKAAQASVKGGSKTWSGLPNTIDYEIKTGGSGNLLSAATGAVSNSITAEVGYNKARGGGKLGNIREFGAPAKSRGPHNDLANALEANQADFQKGLEIAAADGEKAAGL
jgi:hypothetical protein